MTGLAVAIGLGIIIIGVAVVITCRGIRAWRAAGRTLTVQCDLDTPQPADVAATGCARCAATTETATARRLPCACTNDCGANHCLAFLTAIGGPL